MSVMFISNIIHIVPHNFLSGIFIHAVFFSKRFK